MIKKQYVKSRNIAIITFEVPKDELPEGLDVKSLNLVGDFKEWDVVATPMVRTKGDAFRATLDLEPGCKYKFLYLVNGEHWFNEWHADSYTPNGHGNDDCVVVTPDNKNELL